MAPETSKQPLEVVLRLYDLIFAADEEALKASLTDDLIIVHIRGYATRGSPSTTSFAG